MLFCFSSKLLLQNVLKRWYRYWVGSYRYLPTYRSFSPAVLRHLTALTGTVRYHFLFKNHLFVAHFRPVIPTIAFLPLMAEHRHRLAGAQRREAAAEAVAAVVPPPSKNASILRRSTAAAAVITRTAWMAHRWPSARAAPPSSQTGAPLVAAAASALVGPKSEEAAVAWARTTPARRTMPRPVLLVWRQRRRWRRKR